MTEIIGSSPENNKKLNKEVVKPTWPEMHGLIENGKNKKSAIDNPFLSSLAKNLSFGSSNRLSPEALNHWLIVGDEKLHNEEIPADQWALVGGLIDQKITEKKDLEKKISFMKEADPSILKDKGISTFLKERFEIEKKIEKFAGLNSDDFSESQKQEASELINSFIIQSKIPLTETDLGFLGSSSEKPPKIEEIGVEAYTTWFEEKIHALIEEYPDQSFETNWTLSYPLQQAVNGLWPKDGNDEFGWELKGEDGSLINGKDSYSRVRKELALKLESYRALHNFVYLYRRVPGVGDAIGPAGLLDRKYIQYLLKEKQNGKFVVADKLREFYRLGEDYRKFLSSPEYLEFTDDFNDFTKTFNRFKDQYGEKKKQGRLTKALEDRMEAFKKLNDEKKNKNDEFNEQKSLKEKAILDLQEADWRGRIAGALYSAFQGAARDNIVINQGGDFFIGRLYNIPSWVKRNWEVTWGRNRRPTRFYNAFDLQINDFWEEALKKKFDFGKDEDKKFLESLGIVKGEDGILDLKAAKFEEIGNNKLFEEWGVVPDNFKQIVLNLEEADNIRKYILNPQGFVDDPGLRHFKEMWGKFKHLKGEKRSRWIMGVLEQIVPYFKDQRFPDSETLAPTKMRKSDAQEINSDYVGWTNRQIIDAANSLTPPLTEPDKNKLLDKVVGSKFERQFVSAAKTTASVGGSAIWGGIKGFIDGLLKSK